jgi:hypothetical protein
MKKVIFVVTHNFSESEKLVYILNTHPRIRIKTTRATYNDPSDLSALFDDEVDLGIYYGDEILLNTSFQYKQFYKFCNFIYLIRPAKPTINLNLEYKLLAKRNVVKHYCFRLRRIYEMARRTPGAVFLTWNDCANGNGLPLIQDYLKLKEPIVHQDIFGKYDIPELVLPSEIQEAEEYYEKCLFDTKNLDLRIIH